MRRSKKNARRYVLRHYKRRVRDVGRLKNHPFAIPVTTFLILFVLTIIGYVAGGSTVIGASDSRVVQLSIDGQVQTLPTRAPTVADLFKRLNITVQPEDLVEPSLDSQILEDNTKVSLHRARPITIVDGASKVVVLSAYQQPRTAVQKAGYSVSSEDAVEQKNVMTDNKLILGEQLVIDRAVSVTLNLYGNPVQVNTRADTVRDLLNEKQISMTIDGQVFPSPTTRLESGQTIIVAQQGKKVIVSEEDIPFTKETKEDPAVPVGENKIVQTGQNGKKVVAYEVAADGTKRILQQFEAKKPIKEITSKGAKVLVLGTKAEWLVAAGVRPADYAAADYIISAESGWCPTKWQGEYGRCPAYHGAPTSPRVGYGLCQATPASKMSTAGADWASNPVTQLKWCTNYAVTRYGGWQQAANAWRSRIVTTGHGWW